MPTYPVDPANQQSVLNNTLQQTGKLSYTGLDEALYSPDRIANSAGTGNPDVQKQQATDYSQYAGLTPGQAEYLTKMSQNITSQTNNAVAQLNVGYNQKQSQIVTGTQDAQIVSGINIGETGESADKSTRNLSYVQNAVAEGNQQILQNYQSFATNVGDIINKTQANQNQLLNQAVTYEDSNRKYQDARDQYYTQAFGTLYEKGKDTGKLTQQGEQNALNLQVNRANIPNLIKINTNNALNSDEQLKQNQLKTSADTQAFTESQSVMAQQLRQLTTQYGIASTVDQLNNLAKLTGSGGLAGGTTQNKAYTDALNNPNDPNHAQAVDTRNTLIKTYGTGAGLYFGVVPDIKDNKTVGQKLESYDKSVYTKGLFLNTQTGVNGFVNNPAYDALAKNVTGAKPDELLTKDVSDAIMQGKANEILNKMVIVSNSGDKVMVGFKNQDKDKASTAYMAFREVDLAGKSPEEKAKIQADLSNIDSGDQLNQLNEYLNKNSLTTSDVNNATQFMQKLKGGEYGDMANQKMTNGLPDNASLVAAVLVGANKTSAPVALGTLGNYDSKTGSFNFDKLQNFMTNNGSQQIITSMQKSGNNADKIVDLRFLTDFDGTGKITESNTDVKNAADKIKNDYAADSDNMKHDVGGGFTSGQLLKSLIITQRGLNKEYGGTDQQPNQVANNSLVAFLMGAGGLDRDTARGYVGITNYLIKEGKN